MKKAIAIIAIVAVIILGCFYLWYCTPQECDAYAEVTFSDGQVEFVNAVQAHQFLSSAKFARNHSYEVTCDPETSATITVICPICGYTENVEEVYAPYIHLFRCNCSLEENGGNPSYIAVKITSSATHE